MKIMKSLVYARDSSSDDDSSLEAQTQECLRHAGEVGSLVEEEDIIREHGSGMDASRPGFQNLQNRVKDGEISAVFVYSPDRLSRDPRELTEFSQLCAVAGVKIYTVM